MYSDFFGGMLRGASTTVKLDSVRAVEGQYAFADGEQTTDAPDGKVVLVVHLAALLLRDADGWRFVDARPYAFFCSADLKLSEDLVQAIEDSGEFFL